MRERRSLNIQYKEGGALLDLNNEISGKAAIAQACLTTVGNNKASDRTFSEHGTDLRKYVTGGFAATWTGAWHAGNFAALSVQRFQNKFLIAGDKIEKCAIRVEDMRDSEVWFTMSLKFKDGVTFDDVPSAVTL